MLATWPLLITAKRGDGHPVLVLAGLLTGNPTTALLRRVLRARAAGPEPGLVEVGLPEHTAWSRQVGYDSRRGSARTCTAS